MLMMLSDSLHLCCPLIVLLEGLSWWKMFTTGIKQWELLEGRNVLLEKAIQEKKKCSTKQTKEHHVPHPWHPFSPKPWGSGTAIALLNFDLSGLSRWFCHKHYQPCFSPGAVLAFGCGWKVQSKTKPVSKAVIVIWVLLRSRQHATDILHLNSELLSHVNCNIWHTSWPSLGQFYARN